MIPPPTPRALDLTTNEHRVLVVDDDEPLKEALRRGLERSGFRVTLAGSIDRALVALTARPFDAVVTDLAIGEESGLELIERILAIRPDTRIILMSGSVTPEDRTEALRLGV